MRASCTGRFPMFGGEPGQRDPGVDAELLEHMAKVAAGRVGGDEEPLGDLTVGEAISDQPGHGELGVGQGRPPPRSPLPGGQAALDTELAERRRTRPTSQRAPQAA